MADEEKEEKAKQGDENVKPADDAGADGGERKSRQKRHLIDGPSNLSMDANGDYVETFSS